MSNEAKSKLEELASIKRVSFLGLHGAGSRSTVELYKMSDGSLEVNFITPQGDRPNVITSLNLSPATVNLLSIALSHVHNDERWLPVKDVPLSTEAP